MNCEFCHEPFNLTNKYPVELPCCNETICKDCQLKLTGAPQQETFQCPITNCGEQSSCEAIFRINKVAEKLLRESLSIFCDDHQNDLAEFYCRDHDKLVCMECFSDNHNGHTKTKINKKMLFEYHNIILEKLEAEYRRIGKLMTTFEAYQKNQASFIATKYLKKVHKALEILTPRMKTQEERDMIKFLNQDLLPPQQNLLQQIPQQIQPIIPNVDSVLIQQADHQFIKDCFGQANIQLQLLYRGSRDTINASVFHSKCDNQGPTLSLMKSDHDRIFGGYASVSWSNHSGEYKPDDKAFILSLTHKTKHVQYQNQQYAVVHNSKFYPTFGLSCDIYLTDNNFYCNLGQTYSLPIGIQINTNESKSYLSGTSGNFKLTEIEVFKVILN